MNIYEYRAKKEAVYNEVIQMEKEVGKSEKHSIKTSIGFIDIYIYKPENYHGEQLPVFLNLHGGGFVLGFCEQDGKYCQYLSNKAKCAVINIDYCLAPENKFPDAINSTYEVIKYLKNNGSSYSLNTEKMVIGGHSAGGNLSTALVLMAEKKKEKLFIGLIADYAIFDCTDSNKWNKNDRMNDYMSWYFKNEKDKFNEFASPLMSKHLSDFPSTMIISASLDPLCEESKAFSKKLNQSNVTTYYHCFDACDHGFTHDIFNEYNEQASNQAWNLIAKFLQQQFKSII
jgi:acetyl esterase